METNKYWTVKESTILKETLMRALMRAMSLAWWHTFLVWYFWELPWDYTSKRVAQTCVVNTKSKVVFGIDFLKQVPEANWNWLVYQHYRLLFDHFTSMWAVAAATRLSKQK